MYCTNKCILWQTRGGWAGNVGQDKWQVLFRLLTRYLAVSMCFVLAKYNCNVSMSGGYKLETAKKWAGSLS
jgi:hypothetical protein